MRSWIWMAVAWLSAPAAALGVVVDSFDSGAISQGPELTELVVTQDGLPTSEVLGGAREWFALYGGSLEVEPNVDGSLTLDHDRGVFEIASLRYGKVISGSAMEALNSNFTAGGHTQLTLRICRLQIEPKEGQSTPLAIGLNLRSGHGSLSSAGAVAYAQPRNSAEPFVIQVPFTSFVASQQPLDFSDVDGVGVSFFYNGQGLIEIEDISTSSGLPGDYDLNGIVDAADFTVWRDNRGEAFSLPNENPAAQTPGVVDDEDFDFWRTRFGSVFPTASPARGSVVPEPGALCLFSFLVLVMAACRKR